jgi:heme exporter protein A
LITGLAIEGLAISRGDRRLFDGLTFAVGAGEAVALVGANGAGKTSLLRAIAGLIRPDAGDIVFSSGHGPIAPEDARGAGLHLIGHHDGLKPNRTAREEMVFQVRWTGGTAASAAAACVRLDLAGLLDLEVRKLSAGQRRRLALARLIASPRPVWLLDEPLAPLDAVRRALFGEVMGEHLAGGGLIVAAVHDALPVAAREIGVGA